MQKKYFTLFVSLVACLHTFAQQTFKTSKGVNIQLKKEGIYVNGKNLYTNNVDFLLDQPAKLIENGNSVFLFVPYEAGPTSERMYGFSITDKKVDSVVNAPSSDIKDLDGDTYPEFGGIDIGESIPEADSMYYVGSEYFEIRNGKIQIDTAMTINTDVRINGIYLRHPSDNPIPAPHKLVDPLILSERIDGPANIRDEANTVIFSLNDDVPVEISDLYGTRHEVTVKINPTPAQLKSKVIQKGDKLYIKGVEAGTANSTIKLTSINNGQSSLFGYTAPQNIKKNTIAENVLASIVKYHTAGLNELEDYIKGYQLSKGSNWGYTSYSMPETGSGTTNVTFRIQLLFEKNKLFGILHTRTLPQDNIKTYKLSRGFFLTVPNDQPKEKVQAFIKQFNEMMSNVG